MLCLVNLRTHAKALMCDILLCTMRKTLCLSHLGRYWRGKTVTNYNDLRSLFYLCVFQSSNSSCFTMKSSPRDDANAAHHSTECLVIVVALLFGCAATLFLLDHKSASRPFRPLVDNQEEESAAEISESGLSEESPAEIASNSSLSGVAPSVDDDKDLAEEMKRIGVTINVSNGSRIVQLKQAHANDSYVVTVGDVDVPLRPYLHAAQYFTWEKSGIECVANRGLSSRLPFSEMITPPPPPLNGGKKGEHHDSSSYDHMDPPYVPIRECEVIPARPFANIVFGVLSDKASIQKRLLWCLRTYLVDTKMTIIYFSDIPESRKAADVLRRDPVVRRGWGKNITYEFLSPPGNLTRHPNGAWKVRYMIKDMRKKILGGRFFSKKAEGGGENAVARPQWYAIIDDDTYLVAPAVHIWLSSILRQSRPDEMLWAGHLSRYCDLCVNRKKAFPFVFGGDGIFLSERAVVNVGAIVDECEPSAGNIAGDERLGYCFFKRLHVKPIGMPGGVESVFAAVGQDVLPVVHDSPFPCAFHRIRESQWFEEIHRLEIDKQNFALQTNSSEDSKTMLDITGWSPLLSWADVVQRFAIDLKDSFNVTLYFPNRYDPNAIQVQRYFEYMKKRLQLSQKRKRKNRGQSSK